MLETARANGGHGIALMRGWPRSGRWDVGDGRPARCARQGGLAGTAVLTVSSRVLIATIENRPAVAKRAQSWQEDKPTAMTFPGTPDHERHDRVPPLQDAFRPPFC